MTMPLRTARRTPFHDGRSVAGTHIEKGTYPFSSSLRRLERCRAAGVVCMLFSPTCSVRVP